MYDSYYINFISAVPRSLLEELAHAALEAEAVQQIQKVCMGSTMASWPGLLLKPIRQWGCRLMLVWLVDRMKGPIDMWGEGAKSMANEPCLWMPIQVCDQYVNFVSLEDDLFCLSLGNKESISYYALNNPQAKVRMPRGGPRLRRTIILMGCQG